MGNKSSKEDILKSRGNIQTLKTIDFAFVLIVLLEKLQLGKMFVAVNATTFQIYNNKNIHENGSTAFCVQGISISYLNGRAVRWVTSLTNCS